jgi:succinoglycan biosynthesis transport protein ExoP
MRGEWTEDSAAEAGAIDLRGLGRAVAARKVCVIVPTAAAFVLSLAFVTLVHPRYTGVAKVLLENQESYYTRPDKAAPEQAPALDPEAVQSVAEGVTSIDMAAKAIKELDLDSNDEFNPALARGPIAMLMSLMGGHTTRPGDARVVDAFLSHLSAFPVAKTRVLQIEFSSEDPALAARGANVVAQLFLRQQENAKIDSAKSASAWLATRIEALRGKVADADSKVESYRAQAGLFAGPNNLTMNSQQLSDLTSQLATARAAEADAKAKATLMRTLVRQGRPTDELDHTHDDSLRRLSEQRNTIMAQIALEGQILLPGHPRMKELSGELAEVESQIRVAAEKAARSLENEARLATAQVQSLEATYAAQSRTVADGDIDGVKLRALELDARAARDQLESYIQKFREATARDADNSAPADARIIASASEPRSPTYPKKAETLLLGTLAGFVLSVAGVVSQALLSGVAMAPARMPHAEPEAPQPTDAEDDDAVARIAPRARNYFDSAEAAAGFIAGQDSGGRGLTLVAGADGFGAALRIGRVLSQGLDAVLVSLELLHIREEAMIAAPASAEIEAGLAEVVDGEVGFEQVLFRDSASPLDVVLAGVARINPDGLHEAFGALLASYDCVIAFAGNWSDEAALAAAAMGRRVVLVAEASELDAALRRAGGALRGLDLDVIGLAADHRHPSREAAA